MKKRGKDPLEREREIREIIERAALERRQSRGVRRLRPWLRPFGSILMNTVIFFTRPWVALLLFFMCLGGFFGFLFGVGIKLTDVYECSMAEARRSPTVIEELGEPIEAGFFAWMYGYSQEGSVTDTAFSTTLAGPKGKGTLRVQWYSTPVHSSLLMELEKEGQTHQFYRGAVPCR